MFGKNNEDDFYKEKKDSKLKKEASPLFAFLIGGLGIAFIIFYMSQEIPKRKEKDKKLQEIYQKEVENFSQKTESNVIENVDKIYSKQTVFMAEKTRISTWVHPETKVEYIIIETFNSSEIGANATSISITPSLNPDGTIRVKEEKE